jgi:hypothetical protein
MSHHKRGTAVCGNGLTLSIARVDEAVLGTLANDVLRPGVVLAVIDGVLEAMRPQARAAEVVSLRTELQAVEREMARLTEAIAAGGQLASLLEALKVRQARQETLASISTDNHLPKPGRDVGSQQSDIRFGVACPGSRSKP